MPDLLHQRLGEGVHRGLGGAVGGAVGKRAGGRQAADVDDPAAASGAQVRQRRARGVEDAGDVGVEHQPPVVVGHIGDVAEHADAGVVDERVEAAEAGRGGGAGGGHVGGAAHVGAQRQTRARRLPFERGSGRGEACRRTVPVMATAAPRDASAQRRGEPDTSRATGDERHLSGHRIR